MNSTPISHTLFNDMFFKEIQTWPQDVPLSVYIYIFRIEHAIVKSWTAFISHILQHIMIITAIISLRFLSAEHRANERERAREL